MAAQTHTHAGTTRVGEGNLTIGAGAVGLAAIWLMVAVISIFSPDLVSGSEQEHVPLAAILTWIWGVMASRTVVTTLMSQRDRLDMNSVRLLIGIIAAVWVIAAAVAVWGPEAISGSDPTSVPISALIAPIAAMVLTTTACQLFGALSERR